MHATGHDGSIPEHEQRRTINTLWTSTFVIWSPVDLRLGPGRGQGDKLTKVSKEISDHGTHCPGRLSSVSVLS